MGFVYLIQPCELKGTNRFKVGASSLSNLSRLKSYKSGTRYICFFECKDAFDTEKTLIKEFNARYKLIAGREYFEVNQEEDAIALFMNIVQKKRVNKIIEIIDDSVNDKPKVDKKEWMNKFAFQRL